MKQNFFEKPAILTKGWKIMVILRIKKQLLTDLSAHSRKAISINNQTTYNDYEKHVLLFVRKDSDFLFTKQAFKKI